MAGKRNSCGVVQVLGVLLISLVVASLVALQNGESYLKTFDLTRSLYESFDIPELPGTSPLSSKSESPPETIGYAISVTKCQPGDDSHRIDQAAVLLYSIHRNSIRNPDSGSKYDYHAYAFVHPEAVNCTLVLQRVGYDVQIRDSPVLKSEIQGTLKNFVHEASCCQEKEFLKLYSYTLLQYKVVVHFDLDCLVLQPLDDLYDSMIQGPTSPARKRLPLQWVKNVSDLPTDIEAFFTRDYNMVNPGTRQPHQIGVQGGFIVVKPDLNVFEKYKATIIEGDYDNDPGWGGKLQYGGYFGAAQIQGLCAYFFGHIRPGKTAELNRCSYNFMGDGPRLDGVCLTGEDSCEDCRDVAFEEIKTLHFTLCTKPWWCLADEKVENREDILGGKKVFDLCLAAHGEWFKHRFMLEQAWSKGDAKYSTTQAFYAWPGVNYTEMVTLGNCWRGPKGNLHYVPMRFPDERIAL